MNEEIQKQLLARLDAIAAKLGIAANLLWQSVVRQMYVNAWECAIAAVLLAAASIIVAKLVVRYHEDWDEMGVFFSWVFVAGGAIAAFVCAINAVDLFANPTFWAFSTLVEAAK